MQNTSAKPLHSPVALSIAMAIHETVRQLAILAGEPDMGAWNDTDEWRRQSTWDGIAAFRDGKMSTPEETHEEWVKAKQADGWAWGYRKDPDIKTHPLLVPYSDLPDMQKTKDVAMLAILQSFYGHMHRGS